MFGLCCSHDVECGVRNMYDKYNQVKGGSDKGGNKIVRKGIETKNLVITVVDDNSH